MKQLKLKLNPLNLIFLALLAAAMFSVFGIVLLFIAMIVVPISLLMGGKKKPEPEEENIFTKKDPFEESRAEPQIIEAEFTEKNPEDKQIE